MKNAIGIDIGGTNFRIGRVYEDGTVACAEKKPSSALCSGDSAVELLIGEVERFMQANPAEDTCALGIGFPAPVSSDKKTVFACPNLKNTNGDFGNVVEPVSKYFRMPVCIAKDTDMLLRAEITERKTRNNEIVTAFYFGTGVGNSVYYRGAMLSGAHGSGCDAGHIPVYRGTRKCGCGQTGCIECYASGTTLKALWEERFSSCGLEEVFVKHGSDPELAAFIDACACVIATEVVIFDPSLVIVGGGVSEMRGFPFERLKTEIHAKLKKPYPADYVHVERPRVKEHAGIKGAAYFALDLQGKHRTVQCK